MGPELQAVVAMDAGGRRPPDVPKLWLSDPARGLFAIASPLGSSVRCSLFFLQALARSPEPEATQRRTVVEDLEAASLRRVILQAQNAWAEVVRDERSLEGSGATAAVVKLAAGYAVVGHLGDCRVYQVRSGRLLRRTHDHRQKARDVTRDREVNILVRAFGMESNPEIWRWDTQRDDVFLLSSELHGLVGDDEIVETLSAAGSFNAAATTLVALAVERGASDWITALAVRIAPADPG